MPVNLNGNGNGNGQTDGNGNEGSMPACLLITMAMAIMHVNGNNGNGQTACLMAMKKEGRLGEQLCQRTAQKESSCADTPLQSKSPDQAEERHEEGR